jgi:hypothetical protein
LNIEIPRIAAPDHEVDAEMLVRIVCLRARVEFVRDDGKPIGQRRTGTTHPASGTGNGAAPS